MQLAIEFPIPHLKALSKYTDFDFVLTHMVLENKVYRDFYSESKRFMILDNSFFELGQALSGDKIMKAARIMMPEEVVAPDGIDLTEKFIKENKNELSDLGIEVAGVLHGKNFEEIVQNLNWLTSHPDISTICVPLDTDFNLDPHLKDLPQIYQWMITRIMVLDYIYNNGYYQKKQYHLLGCSVPVEFKVVGQKHPWIRSYDTSAPVVAAINKIEMDAVGKKLSRRPDYFDKALSRNTRGKIISNINLMKEWGNGH